MLQFLQFCMELIWFKRFVWFGFKAYYLMTLCVFSCAMAVLSSFKQFRLTQR